MNAPTDRVTVCVAGCGHWGKNLVRNFHALGHLHSICDTDPVCLRTLAHQYPEARAFRSLEEALEDRQLHAVALASPADEHHRMAMAVIEAGKDVFVEKPLALDWQDGQEMVEAAQRRGRLLMVGHLLLYHPAILRIQELLREGELGRLEYVYSNRLSMGRIRQEENALWSFAPHDISVLLMLMGRLPVQATATGGAYLQPNVADVTLSTLLFDHGARAHIFVSWLHPYKEHRLVVIGSKKMVVFEDTRPSDKLLLFDKQIEWENGRMEATQAQGVPVSFGSEEPLRRECQHFLDCVRDRGEPRTPGSDGVQVLLVLQACQRSLQMNGEPVQVNALTAQHVLRL